MRPLLLLLPALACVPTLNNDGPDDDDTTGDDDSVGDDDSISDDDIADDDIADDDIIGDDDVVSPCSSRGFGNFWLEGPGIDTEGTWYDGDLSWDGSTGQLDVTDSAGSLVSFQTGTDAPFWFASGAGRVFWYSPGNTFGRTDSLIAVEAGGVRGAVGVDTFPPDILSQEWSFWMMPRSGDCAEEAQDDGCGLWGVLPIDVEWEDPWGAGSFQLWPGNWGTLSYEQVQILDSYEYYEVYCPDLPSLTVSWSLVPLIFDGRPQPL